MWYGGGIGNTRKVAYNLGHLNRMGFLIPKCKYYEF